MTGRRAILVAILLACLPATALADTPALTPLDPQNPSWPDDTTWNDYKPLPGRDYSDPTIQPSVKKWRVALVMTDFPDREYTVTQPQGSTIYGMPTAEAHDVPRAQVPAFYRDFLNTPQPLNHFQTMNRYWMEDTYGKYGVELVPFGVYRMPFRAYQYFQSQYGAASQCPTPTQTPCNKNFRTDARAAWVAEVGLTVVELVRQHLLRRRRPGPERHVAGVRRDALAGPRPGDRPVRARRHTTRR